MAAALALRHDVFCVEQGVPVRRGARRPRRRGRCTWSPSPTASCWPPAACCSSAPRSSSAGSPSARQRPPPGDRLGAAGARRRRDPGRRRPPARAPRPDLRPLAVRGRRLRAARADVHGGGDRAHRHGEAPPERLPTAVGRRGARAPHRPADRSARDHRRRAGGAPGAAWRRRCRRAIDPATDPFAEGNEAQHAARALRRAARRRSAPDTPGWQVRVVPNRYPALEPDAAEPPPAANPDLFWAAPRAAPTR